MKSAYLLNLNILTYFIVGTFLMVSGGIAENASNTNSNLGNTAEHNAEEQLLVFQRIRQNKFSVVSKLSKLCPLSYEPLVFGGVLGGRILVGCKTDNKMYQYKPDDDEWKAVPVDEDNKLIQNYNKQSRRENINGCAVNDNLYLFYEYSPRYDVELLQFKNSDTDLIFKVNKSSSEFRNRIENSCSRIENKANTDNNLTDDETMDCTEMSNLPILERNVVNFKTNFPHISRPSIINIGNNQVLLLGGEYIHEEDGYLDSRPSELVYIWELTNEGKSVRMKKIENMKKSRQNAIVFKIKNNVYVTGGIGGDMGRTHLHGTVGYRVHGTSGNHLYDQRILSCTERFDLTENKWYPCEYSLPKPLHSASVAVSANESFALITGGVSSYQKMTAVPQSKNQSTSSPSSLQKQLITECDRIIAFDEDNGFQLLESKLHYPRSNHVSIRIK